VSVSFTHLEPPSETTYLRERVARLRASLEWAGDAISPRLREAARKATDRVDERLKLGVDSTIVALAGGTGSGKSSLFNAITRMDFALVGVSRPTTAQPSAATWGSRADPLLDWLGVAPERRLLCETALDEDEESAFRGMVLMDLPDHDSVDRSHRDIVDRLVPMVDLLVWVVDPQKYADNALHSRYLEEVASSGAPSAVVLNQIDRLNRADTDAVMFDIRRLLAEKGIENAPVLLTSVATGAGIDTLRNVLANAVKKRSVAAESVRSLLVATGRDLAKALSKGAEPTLPSVDAFASDLARAAGVDAMAEAADAAASGKGVVPDLAKITPAAVDSLRREWIDGAAAGLPTPWRKVLDAAIAKPRTIADSVGAALATVDWPEVAQPKGIFRRKAKGPAVGSRILALGREAVRAAIRLDVVEPTETIHQAYRALDELTNLATGDTEVGDTATGDTAPGDTASGDTASGDTAPGDAATPSEP